MTKTKMNQMINNFDSKIKNLETKELLKKAETLEEEKAILKKAMADSSFMSKLKGGE